MQINIANWDARSRRDFDRALDLANRFYRSVGEDKAVRIEPGPPPRLRMRYNGKDYPVGLEIEGPLFQAADIFVDPAAVTFNCTIRWRSRPRANDPAMPTDARNAMFLWPGGGRRTVPELTAILVHEITHKQQEINSWLGAFSFGFGYLLTLGLFHEREADRMENRALAFANAADAAGGVTVTIVGPAVLREGQTGTYRAIVQAPLLGWLGPGPAPMVPVTGGVFAWTPRPGQSQGDITATAAGNNTVTIRADDDEGTEVLNVVVTVRQPGGTVTAAQSFQIELAGEAD